MHPDAPAALAIGSAALALLLLYDASSPFLFALSLCAELVRADQQESPGRRELSCSGGEWSSAESVSAESALRRAESALRSAESALRSGNK